MSQQTAGKRAGRVMLVLAWCAALFLATRFFGQWEERQQNPNVVVTSEQGEGFIEVKLVSNRQGHFVASGAIMVTRWISCSIPERRMCQFRPVWPRD